MNYCDNTSTWSSLVTSSGSVTTGSNTDLNVEVSLSTYGLRFRSTGASSYTLDIVDDNNPSTQYCSVGNTTINTFEWIPAWNGNNCVTGLKVTNATIRWTLHLKNNCNSGIDNTYTGTASNRIVDTVLTSYKPAAEQNEIKSNPNPFNNELNFRINMVSSNTKVSLKIYDVQGKEVVTVLDNTTLSKGSYNYSLNTEKLNAGVYMYKMIAGEQNIIGKIIKE